MGLDTAHDDGRPHRAMRKIALAAVAVVAVIAALWLLAYAAFPYFYGESGSASYARAHRGEAIVQILGAAVLLWIAWYCVRHSLSGRTWLSLAGLLVAAAIVQGIVEHRRVPDGVQPTGGSWYVAVVHQPNDIDTVYYRLYYKRRALSVDRRSRRRISTRASRLPHIPRAQGGGSADVRHVRLSVARWHI